MKDICNNKQELVIIIFIILRTILMKNVLPSKSSYFPSPLLRDYNSRPMRNYNPKIQQKQTIKIPAQAILKIAQQPIIYQTVNYEDGLLMNFYQKNNETGGIFFARDYCILYQHVQDIPHGTNYIFYLSGISIETNFQNGYLHNWTVARYEKNFIACYHYQNGIKHGKQYFYDIEDQFIIISEYNKGKLLHVTNGQHGNFHSVVRNKEISNIVQRLETNNLLIKESFPHFKQQGVQYYGQFLQIDKNPNGYGLLFSATQIFMGRFHQGFLDGIGGIKFGTDKYYYGQLSEGVCQGYGVYHYEDYFQFRFNEELITKDQFEKFIEAEIRVDNEARWTTKYEPIEKYQQEFQKYKKKKEKSKSERIESENNLQLQNKQLASQIKLDIDVSSSKHDLQSEKSIKKITHQNNKANNKTVPKLSLFQEIRSKQLKNEPENRVGTARANFTNSDTQERNFTQRREKVPSYTPVNQSSGNKQLMSFMRKKQPEKPLEKKKEAEVKVKKKQRSQRQQMEVEEVGKDKWYVTNEHNFMRPNDFETKGKFNTKRNMVMDKNQGSHQINMGRIMKVGSDVSETNEGNFFERMMKQKNNQY